MALAAAFFAPLLAVALQPDPKLLRAAEEAELFAQSAGRLMAEETLRQKALKGEKRTFFRVGQSALEPRELRYQERELKSEFAYTQIPVDNQPVFHEARQVLSVDGKPQQSVEKARRRLVKGLKSNDDEVKKDLLEDLQKYGLEGSATDFTLMLLLFRSRNLALLEMTPGRTANVGADAAVVYSFEQKDGTGAFTIFNGKETVHQKLQGEIWLRESDGLPLRITFVSIIRAENKPALLDEGTVDYVRSEAGVLTPVSATHRRTEGERVTAENVFTYSAFRRFSADSDVKFSPAEQK